MSSIPADTAAFVSPPLKRLPGLREKELLIKVHGIAIRHTSKEVSDFKLYEDRESLYELQVPHRLARLGFALKAKVDNLSQGKPVDLSASRSWKKNTSGLFWLGPKEERRKPRISWVSIERHWLRR